MKANEANPAVVARHALGWLVVGNAFGVGLAVLLLVPSLNSLLGEWTYGRWMMVHMNVLLYGWCGVPLMGFLFRVYHTSDGSFAGWIKPITWLWSASLVVGSLSWLGGHSSGKLFLDWTGFSRVFVSVAMLSLWVLLALGFVHAVRSGIACKGLSFAAKTVGLGLLLGVPFAVYIASNPNLYPAINPDSGGPTGSSQLESSLGIVLLLLLLPLGITKRKAGRQRVLKLAWFAMVLQAGLCVSMGRTDASHHQPLQYLGLATMAIWAFLMPVYYASFEWSVASQRWRTALLWWWGGLVLSGCVLFLPGVLDRFKFTDGLVGHSLTAVAGFLTAFLIFVMVEVGGEQHAWIFNRGWSFYAWNMGVLAYVLLMTIAGWIESSDPAFTIAPGTARNAFYALRALTGLAMYVASAEWLKNAMAIGPSRTVAAKELGVAAA